jgi:serine protease
MKLNIANFRLMAVLTACLLISSYGIARATVVEGFESGTFSGSEASVGDTGITTSFFGINATEGTHQMLMTTINNGHDAPQTHFFSDAVPNSSIDSFFGLAATQPRDGTAVSQEGSAFSINLGTLTAGSTISFDYDFLTNEIQPGAHNDFAYYLLVGSSTVNVLADTNSAFLHPTTGAGDPFALETGYHTATINITTTGTYTLGLGVSDAVTTDTSSGLLIDNIQVISPVPEPTTIAFSVAGAALLVALRRRIKRTS